jgi:hypothetical protein
MDSAFSQALARGVTGLGQPYTPISYLYAAPSGVVFVVGTFHCKHWLVASTQTTPGWSASVTKPNAFVAGGGDLNYTGVFQYYMKYAGTSPYFTYKGFLFHIQFDGSKNVISICTDGMNVQKNPPGSPSTYTVYAPGGSGGTLVTTVPNSQSSPTYRKEKHATHAGLGASPAPMALIPAAALSKTACSGTWTQILPATASSPKPATPTQPLSSVQLAAQVANYMTYANQAALSGTAPVVQISYAGHLYQITREGPFPGPTATPYVTMCVAPAVTLPGTQGKKVSVNLPGSSAPAPVSTTPAPVGPSQQYLAPVVAAPASSLPPAVALVAGLLGAAVVGGVAYLAFFEE